MKQEKAFYPDYLVEILLVIFLTVELVTVLALLYPQAIGRQIDFSTPFSPKPEWYFLWLYQLIKYFPGRSIIIGTLILPVTGACWTNLPKLPAITPKESSALRPGILIVKARGILNFVRHSRNVLVKSRKPSQLMPMME